MYLPWQPVEGKQLYAPELGVSISGAGVRTEWRSLWGKGPSFEIVFERGLAGLLIVDESSYLSSDLGLPGPVIRNAEAQRLPWPAWYESESPRMALYGDLGQLIDKRITSYWCGLLARLEPGEPTSDFSTRQSPEARMVDLRESFGPEYSAAPRLFVTEATSKSRWA